MTSPHPNHLPEAPLSNSTTLGGRRLAYGFGRDTGFSNLGPPDTGVRQFPVAWAAVRCGMCVAPAASALRWQKQRRPSYDNPTSPDTDTFPPGCRGVPTREALASPASTPGLSPATSSQVTLEVIPRFWL